MPSYKRILIALLFVPIHRLLFRLPVGPMLPLSGVTSYALSRLLQQRRRAVTSKAKMSSA